MAHSKEFQKVVNNTELIKKLISDNGVVDVEFQQWEAMRKFIAKAINKEGTIIDIGCGNGFLLLCLKEWCSHELKCYGVGEDKELLETASSILPKGKFLETNLDWAEKPIDLKNFPKQYTFVYWNVWNDISYSKESELYEYEICFMESLLKMVEVGGRLILGFYDSHDKKQEAINNLQKKFKIGGTIENCSYESDTTVELVAWIDKDI